MWRQSPRPQTASASRTLRWTTNHRGRRQLLKARVVCCTGPVCQYTLPVLMQSSILLHSAAFYLYCFRLLVRARSPILIHTCMTIKFVPFPGARYVLNTGQVKASTPVQSETIPEGVVLTLCAAMKEKSYSVDENITLRYGGSQCKASDVPAIIRKEDVAEDESSINTRRPKHRFMRVLGLIVSDKHRGTFFQSRLSFSRREELVVDFTPRFFSRSLVEHWRVNFVAYPESTTVQLVPVFYL